MSYSEIWHLVFSTVCPVGKAHKDFLSMEMSGFRSTAEAEDYRIQTMYLPFARFSNIVNGILRSADIYQKLHIGPRSVKG